MGDVQFDPGVFDNMTPEQQRQILIAMSKAKGQQKGGVDWGKVLSNFAEDKAKNWAKNEALDSLSGSLASFVGSGASPATSLIPSAPALSSGAAESLASSMGPFLPGQAPITPPTTAVAPGLGSYLGIPGAILGAKGIFDATQMKDKKKAALAGGLSGGGMGLGLSAAAPLLGLGPIGWGGIALMAAGGAGLGGLLAHKSTRDVAKEHTAKLAGQGGGDSVWQDYLGGMRQQYNSAPTDPSKPFAGKYKSWDEYKKAGLEAGDLTGVYGNLNTFGPDWAHLNFDQQKAVTQALINGDLYQSKKGEVVVTDKARAKVLADQALAAFANGGAPATPMPRGGATPNINITTEDLLKVGFQGGPYAQYIMKV